MNLDAVIKELKRAERSMRFARLKAICDHFFGSSRINAMAKKKAIPFQANEYSYRVQYSPDDEAFIGLVDEFPGLSAFAATLEEAVKEIQIVVAEGLQLLNERGEQIPEPLTQTRI